MALAVPEKMARTAAAVAMTATRELTMVLVCVLRVVCLCVLRVASCLGRKVLCVVAQSQCSRAPRVGTLGVQVAICSGRGLGSRAGNRH